MSECIASVPLTTAWLSPDTGCSGYCDKISLNSLNGFKWIGSSSLLNSRLLQFLFFQWCLWFLSCLCMGACSKHLLWRDIRQWKTIPRNWTLRYFWSVGKENWRCSHWISGESFWLWGVSSTGRGFLGRLCSVHSLRFSRPEKIKPWVTWSNLIADSALSRSLD